MTDAEAGPINSTGALRTSYIATNVLSRLPWGVMLTTDQVIHTLWPGLGPKSMRQPLSPQSVRQQRRPPLRQQEALSGLSQHYQRVSQTPLLNLPKGFPIPLVEALTLMYLGVSLDAHLRDWAAVGAGKVRFRVLLIVEVEQVGVPTRIQANRTLPTTTPAAANQRKVKLPARIRHPRARARRSPLVHKKYRSYSRQPSHQTSCITITGCSGIATTAVSSASASSRGVFCSIGCGDCSGATKPKSKRDKPLVIKGRLATPEDYWRDDLYKRHDLLSSPDNYMQDDVWKRGYIPQLSDADFAKSIDNFIVEQTAPSYPGARSCEVNYQAPISTARTVAFDAVPDDGNYYPSLRGLEGCTSVVIIGAEKRDAGSATFGKSRGSTDTQTIKQPACLTFRETSSHLSRTVVEPTCLALLLLGARQPVYQN